MLLTIYIKLAFTRTELPPFETSVSAPDDIFLIIKKKLEEYGLSEIADDRFYTYDGKKLTLGNISESISDNTLFVLYNNMIPPYGAHEYDRKDGMVFFFHTSETPHREYPHIHVRHSGKKISIYINTLKVIGNTSDHKFVRRAIQYVKTHKDDLLCFASSKPAISLNLILGMETFLENAFDFLDLLAFVLSASLSSISSV